MLRLIPAVKHLPECSSAPGKETIFTFSHFVGNRGLSLPIRSAECLGDSPRVALSTRALKYLNAAEANYLLKGGGGGHSVRIRGTHGDLTNWNQALEG